MILQILGFLPKLLGFADNIRKDIANERIVLINAKTAKEKQESLERIQQLEMQAAVQVAEAEGKNPLGVIFRFVAFGLPAGLAIWKLVVWDKVLGSYAGCAGKFGELPGCEVFRTDDFDANMWWVILAAAGFYLVTSRK